MPSGRWTAASRGTPGFNQHVFASLGRVTFAGPGVMDLGHAVYRLA